MDKKKILIICLGILAAGIIVTSVFFITEPTAERSGATKQTAMLVDVAEIKRGSYRPNIIATGTVEAAQDIILSPRVSGQIISVSDAFTPGGYVTKGETLLRIDPTDYENALMQRKSDLSEAETALSIELGRQEIAEQDYELLDEELSEDNKSLVLRKPQLNAAKAKVEAAKAAVKQAELNLYRTNIKAPFNAHIISRNANVGSQVAAGNNLGRLVGLDTYWVVATVPVSKLKWISFPENNGNKGAHVKLINSSDWGKNEFRTGYVHRLVGALENQTRMARIIAAVPDPLAYRSASDDKPPLMIGSFLEAQIQGKEIENVFRIKRDYIRNDETVWVMEDGELHIKKVNIIFRDSDYAYINEGLNDNDKVVTTNLSTVVEGSPLRLEGAKTTSGESE